MEKEKVKEILESVKITMVESKDKNNLFTPAHTKFICEITNNKGSYLFTYQCNINYIRPNKNSLLACCLSDSNCYEDCLIGDKVENIQEFALMFGYENNVKELLKAFNGCKEAYNALNKMFTKEEKDLLYNYFVEIGEI